MVAVGLTFLVSPVVPSFHVTVPAQFETVKAAELPEHMVGLLTLGVGLDAIVTVTVPEALPIQVPTLQVAL